MNPLWYAGSFLIGSLAGALGDPPSLGFLSETERQVESHLARPPGTLAGGRRRSRAILEQMNMMRSQHGAKAEPLGAATATRLGQGSDASDVAADDARIVLAMSLVLAIPVLM